MRYYLLCHNYKIKQLSKNYFSFHNDFLYLYFHILYHNLDFYLIHITFYVTFFSLCVGNELPNFSPSQMFLLSIRRSRTFILCASVTLCLHSALLPTSRYLNKLQHVCASNVSLYLSNAVIYLYLKALFILSLYKVAGVCHYLFQFRKG